MKRRLEVDRDCESRATLYESTTISMSTESGITADRTLPLLSRYTHSMMPLTSQVIGGRYRCDTGKLGHGDHSRRVIT